ncbi:hypothetical protein [Undibacterium sp. TJN19]|uniref:hypothetical protein n=1 Tax=Undibacterium sp. TJN19 TaxID=3413055 RepID=UPI003BF3E351
MKKINSVFLVGLLAIGSATPGYAACKKARVCDDFGNNCKIQDICDSKLDLPSVQLPPPQPLPPTQLKPLPSTSLPPLGTTKCEYKQVNGAWKNVCQ